MKQKIAILAQFPIWIIDSSVTKPNAHYAVWLVSLYQSLHLLSSSFEFHWITLNKGVNERKIIESNQQFFHILPERSMKLGQVLHYIRERYLIFKEIRLINPDLIHAWGTENYYAISGKQFKGKKILSMQGILTSYCQRGPMPKFQVRQSKFEKKTLSAYPFITAESPWAVDRCREIAPNAEVQRWEYAVNQIFFHIKRKPAATPNCLLAGTATPIKDVETAIAAFSMPALAHVNLYMAGIDPEKYPNLPSNIIPLGRVSREKIQELLAETWCLVHPSLADCCPNIVKEARVIGVPCIVTTECGAKQYIIEEKSGFIIPTKSPEILKDRVLHIIQDVQTSLEMGNYDRERCRLSLHSDTMLQDLIKIYDGVLSSS